jgi:hypothetical protein
VAQCALPLVGRPTTFHKLIIDNGQGASSSSTYTIRDALSGLSVVRSFETDQAFREGKVWLIRGGAIDLCDAGLHLIGNVSEANHIFLARCRKCIKCAASISTVKIPSARAAAIYSVVSVRSVGCPCRASVYRFADMGEAAFNYCNKCGIGRRIVVVCWQIV